MMLFTSEGLATSDSGLDEIKKVVAQLGISGYYVGPIFVITTDQHDWLPEVVANGRYSVLTTFDFFQKVSFNMQRIFDIAKRIELNTDEYDGPTSVAYAAQEELWNRMSATAKLVTEMIKIRSDITNTPDLMSKTLSEASGEIDAAVALKLKNIENTYSGDNSIYDTYIVELFEIAKQERQDIVDYLVIYGYLL